MKLINISEKIHKLPFIQNVNNQKIDSLCVYNLEIQKEGQTLHCDLASFPGLSSIDATLLKDEILNFFDGSLKDATKKQSAHLKFLNYMIEYYDDIRSFETNSLSSNALYRCDQASETKILNETKTIKLKINSNNLKRAKSLIEKSVSQSFRLDANASLTKEELINFVCDLERDSLLQKVDYFEEPLKNINDYNFDFKVPIALDENYRLRDKYSHVKTIVFKPSQYPINDLFNMSDYRIIISSAFDPPMSYACTCYLANLFAPNEWHGLDAKI